MNLKPGDNITVHFFNKGKEFPTNVSGKEFTVYEKNGRLGIDYMADSTSLTRVWYDETGFTPLDSFATENGAVEFRRV